MSEFDKYIVQGEPDKNGYSETYNKVICRTICQKYPFDSTMTVRCELFWMKVL